MERLRKVCRMGCSSSVGDFIVSNMLQASFVFGFKAHKIGPCLAGPEKCYPFRVSSNHLYHPLAYRQSRNRASLIDKQGILLF